MLKQVMSVPGIIPDKEQNCTGMILVKNDFPGTERFPALRAHHYLGSLNDVPFVVRHKVYPPRSQNTCSINNYRSEIFQKFPIGGSFTQFV